MEKNYTTLIATNGLFVWLSAITQNELIGFLTIVVLLTTIVKNIKELKK